MRYSPVQRARRRAVAVARSRWPDRRVVRQVQGIRLTLPWSHMLPDYTKAFPSYGQNLVALSRELAYDGAPLVMVDVGANVGDSALQVLEAVDARVLCVEGDPYWLDYLRTNTGADSRVTVEPSLLLAESTEQRDRMAPVRSAGTSRFVAADAPESLAGVVSPGLLRRLYPDFQNARLIKSDTDGFDVQLVPALAAAWHRSAPVLFFEYDHELSRRAGCADPTAVWERLSRLGYDAAAVWDNFGNVLGRLTIDRAGEAATVLEGPFESRQYHYWDVAAVHASDARGHQALDRLMPGEMAQTS